MRSMMKSLLHTSLALSLTLSPTLVTTFAPGGVKTAYAQSADYDTAVFETRQLIDKEEYDKAVTSSLELITQEFFRYEGYYYVSLAYYHLDKLKEAEDNIEKALTNVGEYDKPMVDKLKAKIELKKRFKQRLAAADALQRNNDYDEAAEAYFTAWKVLGEGEYEVVIKALEYYISEKKYTKALVIIQRLKVVSDPKIVAYAQKLEASLNNTSVMKDYTAYKKLRQEGDHHFEDKEYEPALDKYQRAYEKVADRELYKRIKMTKEELAFSHARTQSSPSYAHQYLSDYPEGRYVGQVTSKLKELYWKQARRASEQEDLFELDRVFNEVRDRMSDESLIRRVKKLLAELHFQKAEAISETSGAKAEVAKRHYRSYLKLLPNGPHAEECQDQLDFIGGKGKMNGLMKRKSRTGKMMKMDF